MQILGAPMAGVSQVSGAQSASNANGLIRFVGNDELKAAEDAAVEASYRQNQPVVTSLSAYIAQRWEDAKRAKRDVEDEMLQDYRQRSGEYDPTELAAIREQGGSEIFAMLTSIKCEALVAWLTDVLFQPGDKSWQLDPSPMAEIPPNIEAEIRQKVTMQAQQVFMATGRLDVHRLRQITEEMRDTMREQVQQRAEDAAERMEKQVEDDLARGDWEAAITEALHDLATTKAMIVHGPVFRRKEVGKWVETEEGWQEQKTEELVKTFERVSPFDIYPSSDATTVDDGDFIHHQRLTPSAIAAMKGVPGFDDSAIDAALMEFQSGGLRDWLAIDQQRREIEQKKSYGTNQIGTIDTLSFWGKIPGATLIEFGMEGQGIEPTKQYEVNVWQIGNWTIGVNFDASIGGKRPYSKDSFRRVPGSFWGEGLAHEIRDVQRMCSAALRECANNMGLASGPQTVINDTGRLPTNEAISNIYPWKIWQFGPDKAGTANRPPIEFFQPNPMTAELFAIYEKFAQIADQVSGVPNYAYGDSDVGGAGETASGLSMLMTSASRGIKLVVRGIDNNIIKRTVWMDYATNMIYQADETMKGDLEVTVRGSSSLIAKEQQMIRRKEFLDSTNNPVDFQIMGAAGRATLLRENAKSLDLPLDDVVPDPESLREQEKQAEIQGIVTGIAAMLGVSPEQVMNAAQQGMQMIQQNQQQGGGVPQVPDGQALAPDGQPVAGQDTRLFN